MRNTILTAPCPPSKRVRSVCGNYTDIRKRSIGDHPASPCTLNYRQFYYEALDLIINCVRSRFDQPGYNTYKHLQELLLKAINHEDFQSELEFVSQFYRNDVNKDNLKIQLHMLSLDFPKETKPPSVFTILAYIKTLSSAKKQLLSEVCTILNLVLVMPAINASSERSFSALRRVKSYFLSTIHQDGLNNLMVLHIHDERTDELDLRASSLSRSSPCRSKIYLFRPTGGSRPCELLSRRLCW